MRQRKRIAALAVAALLLLPAAAQARVVSYPAVNPQIALDAPDDWSVAETSLGLELQSPQKDSLVLVGLTGGDRSSVDGWSKRALARMAAAGVTFGKAGSVKPATLDKPKPAAPASIAADLARSNGDRPYTFGGAPSIEPPKFSSEDTPPVAGRAGDVDLPTVSNFPVNADALKTAGHFLYAGGALRGQPVDVELTVFALGKNKRLLTEQQSGPTDARGFTIVRSLREFTQ